MTNKERVSRAIHFQKPDRIPHLLYDGGENDILWLWSERAGENPWKDEGDGRWSRIDAWGGGWERFGPEGNGELVEPSLSDWADADTMAFPDWNNPACYKGCHELMQQKPDLYKLGVINFGLFEGPEHVRRMDNLLMDFCEFPQQLDRLLSRFADAQMASIDIWAGLGADGIMSYDDLGLQDRPMLSVDMFRTALLPHYRRVWKHAHDRGVDVWMHSCGYIMPYLDDLIAAGLNVIQMDQQENMGLEELGRRFGGRLAFWCPVDIQRTMAHGSVEQIEAYVQQMVQHLGSYGGGLISKAYPQPDVIGHDPAKTVAMCKAFRCYGKADVVSRGKERSS